MKKLLGTFAVALLGGAVALGAYTYFFPQNPYEVRMVEPASYPTSFRPAGGSTPLSRSASLSAVAGAPDFVNAANKTLASVVHVEAIGSQEVTYNNPFYEYFYGQSPRRSTPTLSSGSGVIIDSDGYIVTNNHVIYGASKIRVTMDDNRVFTASLVGTDPTTDIALLQVDENDLPFIPFTNSDEVRVGEWVLAVGNPFNLTSTVTAGIVSAKGRSINIIPERFAIESFIQTDAAVNPGNSGGALVNTDGALVGINTAISTRTGSFEGYSFAVPANMVSKVVSDLKEYGTVQRAFIGVNIRDVNAQLAKEFDLNLNNGVYVGGLTEEGAAADAGMKVGDIIVAVNDVPVQRVTELQEQIARYRPGDRVNVLVNREGQERNFSLVLRNMQGSTSLIDREELMASRILGAELELPSQRELSAYGVDHGVRIKALESGKLRSEGIREGFIITEITVDNQTYDIKRPKDVGDALKGREDVGVFVKGFYPGGKVRYYAFGL
ncbi:MAG: trypsin-like peptidase domain-containing protein [Flavobacteriales bacterium]|nr:trypsin-like peptidase domain-containing protein [Flavobacteriales bacterium]